MCVNAERFRRQTCVCVWASSSEHGYSSVLLASPLLSLKWGDGKFLRLTWISHKYLMPKSLSLFHFRSSTDGGSKWGKTFFLQEAKCFFVDTNRAEDLRLLQQGPCRRLLTNLIKGLDAHLFDSQHDIYMPNCDKRGFFRKKQARYPPQTDLKLTSVLTPAKTNQSCVFCFAPRCSAGRLEGNGAASAGVWIRTACKSHQTPVRRGAWPVRSTQNLDSGTRRGGVQDEGPQQELSLSLHQPKQHSHQGRPASEPRCNLVLLRPLLKFRIKFTKQNIRQSTWTNVN